MAAVPTSVLKKAIMNGPVTVAIETDQAMVQRYTSGTVSSGCGTNLRFEDAIMNGPVSVAIEADQATFQRYTRGTISSDCGTNLLCLLPLRPIREFSSATRAAPSQVAAARTSALKSAIMNGPCVCCPP